MNISAAGQFQAQIDSDLDQYVAGDPAVTDNSGFLPTVNRLLDEILVNYRRDRADRADLDDGEWVHHFGTWLKESPLQAAELLAVALHRLASLTQDLNDYGPVPAPTVPDNWPPMAGDVWHTFPPPFEDGTCAPWEAWHAVRVAFPENAPEGGLVLIYPFGNEDFSRPSQLLPSDFLTRGEARLAYREWEEDQ